MSEEATVTDARISTFSRRIRALRALRLCPVLLGAANSYLNATGWLRSALERSSVDANGQAIPWITFPCIRFLEGRLARDMAVFEFGSGSSTRWWAERVKRVVSCEHDLEWFKNAQAHGLSNVELIYASRVGDEYSAQVLRYDREFDIVIIDGRDRVRCARNCLGALKADGVIVWDNSDRDYYRPGFDFLKQEGFRRIDFCGMAPMVMVECATSIFYRDDNCLAL